jgi:hypothetical protein
VHDACIILMRIGNAWDPFHTGSSHFNTDADGRYDRELGRQRALRTALSKKDPAVGDAWRRPFNKEPWAAHGNRARKARGAS